MILMTLTEAAAFLKSTEKTLLDLVGQDNIPYRHRGRKLLFIREELEAWIDDQPGHKFQPHRHVSKSVDTPSKTPQISTDLHRSDTDAIPLRRGATRQKIRIASEG